MKLGTLILCVAGVPALLAGCDSFGQRSGIGQGETRQVNVVGPYIETLTVESGGELPKLMDSVADQISASDGEPGISQSNTNQPAAEGQAGATGPNVVPTVAVSGQGTADADGAPPTQPSE